MFSIAHAKPELSADQTAQVDAIFAPFNQKAGPGASVGIVRAGRMVFAKGYGLADLTLRTPNTPETNFRLASVSKQFTALAVLMLRERGKLTLGETLPAFFAEFPAFGQAITVRQLLTHSSGLLDYEDLIPPGTTLPVLDQDVLRLIIQDGRTNRVPTYFPPGTQYRYSNTAYSLLALIVQARSGQTFARFLRDNIFQPLGMSNTLAYEAGSSRVSQRAFGHRWDGTNWERADQSLTSSVLGDGGIYSSLQDLFKWDQALYTTNLVSAATREEAFTPHIATDKPGKSYGYGWYLTEYRGSKQIWHSGETIGFRTRLVRIPEQQLTVIILSNRSDQQLAPYADKVIDLMLSNP
ncbi:MAG TPA: serine hydrolase domain-containing protein [Verrucomicrobiota bacterium]|nr:serine hydrolase domain-containing protein [Verrucomicrobiota bacterium]HNT13240.1 serine hydrolase domain-containing protein [Verrucomicrobiota bacterium]